MRSLDKVIDQMLAVIPAEEVELIESLNASKRSFMYSSPEMIPLRWRVTAEILEEQFETEPKDGWALQVINIWMDKNEVSP